MKIPSADRIAKAQQDIEARGPVAAETLALSALAIRDPTLKELVNRQVARSLALLKGLDPIEMEKGLDPAGEVTDELRLRAVLIGMFISGLNIGLTVKD
jgi:hypothetical protein